MDLEALTWGEWLLRGGVGSIFFLSLMLLARLRWRERNNDGGEAGIGLD